MSYKKAPTHLLTPGGKKAVSDSQSCVQGLRSQLGDAPLAEGGTLGYNDDCSGPEFINYV